VEADLVHLGHARREGDEGANDRQHAAQKYRDGAVAIEEVVNKIEVATAEQQVASVALDHGAAAAGTDPVGRDGANVRGQRSQGGEDDEVHAGVGQRVAGKGHDDFRWDGNAGGLEHHEGDHNGVLGGEAQPQKDCDEF